MLVTCILISCWRDVVSVATLLMSRLSFLSRLGAKYAVTGSFDSDYQSSLVIEVKFGVFVNGLVVLFYIYFGKARYQCEHEFQGEVAREVLFLTSVRLSRCMHFTNHVLLVTRSYGLRLVTVVRSDY